MRSLSLLAWKLTWKSERFAEILWCNLILLSSASVSYPECLMTAVEFCLLSNEMVPSDIGYAVLSFVWRVTDDRIWQRATEPSSRLRGPPSVRGSVIFTLWTRVVELGVVYQLNEILCDAVAYLTVLCVCKLSNGKSSWRQHRRPTRCWWLLSVPTGIIEFLCILIRSMLGSCIIVRSLPWTCDETVVYVSNIWHCVVCDSTICIRKIMFCSKCPFVLLVVFGCLLALCRWIVSRKILD